MRSERFLWFYAALLSLVTASAGCAGATAGQDGGDGGDGGDDGPVSSVGAGGQGGAGGTVDDGEGQPAKDPLPYPEGPYGYAVGSTLENYKFYGLVNAAQDSMTYHTIELAELYNPTGLETFPDGSPYGAGTPKPTTLLIFANAVWAAPGGLEADMVLPPKYAQYKPCGGEFLTVLMDGPSIGTAATLTNLQNWTSNHAVNYPSAVDPAKKLLLFFEAEAYPTNMIIDTRTMKLVKVIAGVPGDPFWSSFEATLDNDGCL